MDKTRKRHDSGNCGMRINLLSFSPVIPHPVRSHLVGIPRDYRIPPVHSAPSTVIVDAFLKEWSIHSFFDAWPRFYLGRCMGDS